MGRRAGHRRCARAVGRDRRRAGAARYTPARRARRGGGRVLGSVIAGGGTRGGYGGVGADAAARYERTREFMRLVRRLWTEEHVDFVGRFYRVRDSTCLPRPVQRPHPPLYFGG